MNIYYIILSIYELKDLKGFPILFYFIIKNNRFLFYENIMI